MQLKFQGWCGQLRILPVLCLLALAGCAAGPPIQEMSDARQAIAAAREAGAAELAPAQLKAAEEELAVAESDLQRGVYWKARESARRAKDDAVEALLKSRTVRANAGGAPPAGASPP